MSNNKKKSGNEGVSIDNDQLGENKNNNGGGKKDVPGSGTVNK